MKTNTTTYGWYEWYRIGCAYGAIGIMGVLILTNPLGGTTARPVVISNGLVMLVVIMGPIASAGLAVLLRRADQQRASLIAGAFWAGGTTLLIYLFIAPIMPALPNAIIVAFGGGPPAGITALAGTVSPPFLAGLLWLDNHLAAIMAGALGWLLSREIWMKVLGFVADLTIYH